MSEPRDFEDVLPEIISEAQQHELDIVVRFLETVMITKNHDAILAAWIARLKFHRLEKDPQYLNAAAIIQKQKPSVPIALDDSFAASVAPSVSAYPEDRLRLRE